MLLDCPFCGEIPKIEETNKGYTVTCYGNSGDCDAGLKSDNWTRDGAIELWNTRKGDKKHGK